MLRFALFQVPDRDAAERNVEGDRRDETLVDGVLDSFGEGSRGFGLQRGQPEPVKGQAGQVEMIGAAHLVFAVNVGHISLRVLGEAGARFRQQVLPPAEQDRAGWAGLGARGYALGFEVGVPAEVALHDLRYGAVPLELGDVERARDLAVAAADAGVFAIINDACLRVLRHRADGADRDAGRILAMHARILDVRPALRVLV